MNTLEINKNILNIIRYGAVIPILIFSVIMTYIIIDEKNSDLKNEIANIKSNFYEQNKRVVKDEVLRVIDSINFEIENSENELKEFLKAKVYEAHSIATNIYKEESSHEKFGHVHSEEHILNTIKFALGGMRYNNGRGYIFLDDINGIKVLQPINTELEGKSFLDYEDAKGYKFIKKIVQTIKNKTETYDKYYWYKSKSDPKSYEKMSFYKYFEPFDMAIGTGEYLVDFENELKKRILKRINNIRFGDNGYIFAFDNQGTYLSHFKEKNLGTNGFLVKDAKGDFFIKDLFEFAKKNDDGYFSYTATSKPNGKIKNRKKISYVIHHDKWDWVLGAGFYLQELNETILKRENELKLQYQVIVNKIIFISFVITIILLIASFYTSQIVANKFRIYRNAIKKEVARAIEKDKLLVQQSRLATMGEMIANISHQWRQPLSAISTAATGSKLQKEMLVLEDKDFYNAMDSINDSAQYLSQTIEDFRNFFNPNKEKEKFKISMVFKKTSKLLYSRFKDYDIKIVSDIKEFELFEVENELVQVLINLLKNAKDELIKKELGEKRLLFIQTFEENGNKIIKIKDNAGGVPIELLDRVFDPYFTTKKESSGTGIGLYMSKEIITRMNGTIDVSNETFIYENENYKGAEFKITFLDIAK